MTINISILYQKFQALLKLNMFILTCTKPIVLQGFQTAIQAFTWNQSNPQEILFPQETYVLFEIFFLICKIGLKESKGEVLQN